MKKKRRKTEVCLNCGYKLDPTFDYCPSCGQENTDNQISFGKLVSDFFSNYFSLDSRFGRSIFPFFLKPGNLTKEFMDGKRVKYANPIRLYLVVSLIHFFLMNLYLDSIPSEGKVLGTSVNVGDEKSVIDSLRNNPEMDSLLTSSGLDSLYNSQLTETDSSEFNINSNSESVNNWTTIYQMSKADFTLQQIEDSIDNEEKEYIQRKFNRQLIKVLQSDQHALNMFIVKNIPILMFFLLPLYALILKLYFRNKLYINHVVHGLHIHSFVFILLSIYWVTKLISEEAAQAIDFYILILILVYIYVSFKNTYQKKYVSTFFRVFLTGISYSILLSIGMLLEIVVSLFFY